MLFHTALTKTSMLGILLICLIFSISPAAADRGVSLEKNHFLRLQNKRAHESSGDNHSYSSFGNENEQPASSSSRIRITPKTRNRASLLARSFMLAAIFWTVKFILPHSARWLSKLCKDISEFKRLLTARANEMRRRKKTKSRHVDTYRDDSTVLTSDTQSISPSVMEIMGLGDVDDDNSSFLSTTGSSFASVFHSVSHSVGSFSRSRRKSKAPSPNRSSINDNRNRSAKQEPKRESKSKYSKSSKRGTYADEETGNDDIAATKSLPKHLDFIDEDSVSVMPESKPQRFNRASSRSKQHGSKDKTRTATAKPPSQRSSSNSKQQQRSSKHDNRNKPSLDDISHLPTAGDVVPRKSNSGYTPIRKRDQNKSDSPLERKLSGEYADNVVKPRSKKQHSSRQEKHRPSSSGRHRHRA